jgi:hypothetical protein
VVLPYTIHQAMVECGLDDNIRFNGNTAAQRISTEIFGDDFRSCMDLTITELSDAFKSLSVLTLNQGQIRVKPSEQRNIKAFIQWTRDRIRRGEAPHNYVFSKTEAVDLIRRLKTVDSFVSKSKTITETAKPNKLRSNTKWTDWLPTFKNFLRAIPGRHSVPLAYIIRDNTEPTENVQDDFLENYISMCPLDGSAFKADASEVHTYLVNFIAGNDTAEAKILSFAAEHNGRKDFIALKEHYEGVGINAIDIVHADKVIETLFYSGEKKPHMWWDEFEKQLTMSFAVYDKKEQRQVYSDDMKLRILCRKINADFLQSIRTSISIELTRIPVTMTYNQALTTFRNEVNRKFPPQSTAHAGTRTRRINQVNQRGGGRHGQRNHGGRYQGRGGRGHGRGHGRDNPSTGSYSGNRRNRNDARSITGHSGRTIEVHPSYKFPQHIWDDLPTSEQDRIHEERSQYKRNRANNNPRQVGQLRNDNYDANSIVSTMTNNTNNGNAPNQQNNPENDGSIMGGRNEQASLRQRRPNE